jgi:glutamyl-tRNA synthetase
MPLLRNTDKSKISKRKNPAARLTWFREEGYLPEALVNFLGLLGYSLPSGEEIFTFADMSATFDWGRVNTVGPVFDLDKLEWLNGHYLRELEAEDFVRRVLPFLQREGLVAEPATDEQLATLRSAVPEVQPRMKLLTEAPGLLRFLLVDESDFEVDPAAAEKSLAGEEPVLTAAAAALEAVTEWDTEHVQGALDAALVDGGLGLKRGKAYAPIRAAVCGSTISPPLPESLALLGKERTLLRLRAAQALVAV